MIKEVNLEIPLISDRFYERLSEEYNDRKLFVFKDGQKNEVFLTGKLLHKKVRMVSTRLRKYLKAQEKAVIVLPQSIEYVYSILACFNANIIAIPTAIQNQADSEFINKLKPILANAGATCIITNTNFSKIIKAEAFSKEIEVLNVETLEDESLHSIEKETFDENGIALLLYTSGSTSEPKGVQLTYKNIVSQATVGARQWHMTNESQIVSWMPQFHNFGLNFNILSPLVKGASSVILTSDNFVKSPETWFKMMAEYHCTHTAAPNFAFDYCISAIQPQALENIKLDCVEAIVSGGEPIRKATVEEFFEKFHKIGLNKEIFCPHYGMSEAGSITTKVPGTSLNFLELDIPSLKEGTVKLVENEEQAKWAVSCGSINEDTEVICANPNTFELSTKSEIGEIWVHSPSICIGYYNQDEETERAFASVVNGEEDKKYFRTGDLGFIENNELFVIGREKETIVIRGKNYNPVDLEWTIKNKIDYLKMSLSVFSVEQDDQEKVIVVQEVEAAKSNDYYKSVVKAIRNCISETFQLEVWEIVLVCKGNIPRTGGGKIQRKSCKQLYINNELNRIIEVQNEDALVNKDIVSVENIKEDIVRKLFNDVFLAVINVDYNDLREANTFGELGMNSMKYVQLSKHIEDVFNIEFAPVLMFKYHNIDKLAEYISTEVNKESNSDIENREVVDKSLIDNTGNQDIAVIGMSCNFPGEADNPKTFWSNIFEGKDSIKDVGQHRPWIVEDIKLTYGINDEEVPRWCGLINDVDKFDAQFFGISTLEAESMDPQQRKALELTWNVIEDSGYDPLQLSDMPVGLYLGVHSQDYGELIARHPHLMDTYGAYLDSGLHASIISHRVSRWFNFHGPSEVINTACSSSLVAVHHAVEALQKGDCTMAIAGGINLILSSKIFVAGKKAGMLSADGHCKTFDEKANGFVRAEGYGAVLLKPYQQALKDNDSIYGVIKGIAINHDGQSNSLRAPNLNAQRSLIKTVYDKSNIPVETISYIEAHGTGTPLGDPIECQALQEAFRDLNPNHPKNFCGLGSVKTNIGHLESAAGIAGLIKVLLSMKNKVLPGILHFNKLNSYIKLEDTPFYIIDKKMEWERLKDTEGNEIPRRAGISSFGFGGANAHIILEEFERTNEVMYESKNSKVLVPFSAKNKEVLKSYASKLLNYLTQSGETFDITSIAYTLQQSHANLEERIAFIVKDIPELIEKLTAYVEGVQQDIINMFTSRKSFEVVENKALSYKKTIQCLEEVALHWVQGGHVKWENYYNADMPVRLNLPTYPFLKTKYWIPEVSKTISKTSEGLIQSYAHPLIRQNRSTFEEHLYSTKLTGMEPYFEDHVINKKKTLPGVVYLEMAREAFKSASSIDEKENSIVIKDVVWHNPVTIANSDKEVSIGLYPTNDTQAFFEIFNPENKQEDMVIYCQGLLSIEANNENTIDIKQYRRSCEKEIAAIDLYNDFKSKGIVYGSSHRCVKEIIKSDDIAVAHLEMNNVELWKQWTLYPGIMDSALQISSVLHEVSDLLYIPYSINAVKVIKRCQGEMWAVCRRQEQNLNVYDIYLCDNDGTICVDIQGLSFIPILQSCEQSIKEKSTVMYYPIWKEKLLNTSAEKLEVSRKIVLIEPEEAFVKAINLKMPKDDVIVINSNSSDMATNYKDYAMLLMTQLQEILKTTVKENLLLQVVISAKENTVGMGLSGMLKAAMLENPMVITQIIGTDQWNNTLIEQLEENYVNNADKIILYKDGKRFIQQWDRIPNNEDITVPWKDGGIYLITGGMGGIGYIFARQIAEKVNNPKLVLVGRSALDTAKEGKCRSIESLGAKVIYKPMNVGKLEDVQRVMDDVIKEFGTINGIIHSAGIIQDSFILNKTNEELDKVFQAKVNGVINLDTASKAVRLDCFIMCSSIAGTLGNGGQSDYAAANAFMDNYAVYRNNLVKTNARFGHTLSMNWPLWKEGGMQVDSDVEAMMFKTMGAVPMDAEFGIKALYDSLVAGRDQVMVIHGVETTIERYVSETLQNPIEIQIKENYQLEDSVAKDRLEEKAIQYLMRLFSSVTRISVDEIDPYAPLENYGIDSILIMQLISQMENTFGNISKTLFFEYKTIKELAVYLLEVYNIKLADLLGMDVEISQAPKSEIQQTKNIKSGKRLESFRNKHVYRQYEYKKIDDEDIAIIGLAGKYPNANNMNEFWEVLKDGVDCITEIPKSRWDHSQYFDPDLKKKGKTYTKWGGFIDGVDAFDPLFFNISPREAELMDPQERLFLQCAHEAIEDSGYSKESLGKKHNQNGDGNVGVFVGVMFEEYPLYGAQLQAIGINTAISGSIGSIANRVSYVYNLHGPSMSVDTMCSSSLTTVHLACQSLRNNDCEVAIAGGVNISIHPNKYLLLAQGKFASSKGRCETFGDGGDGYVPGEGVGAVILKPLSKAIADGNHIYGVIKSTYVNHGGKTNGYTVPNPQAQANVIGRAIEKSNIDPRTISYVEAHGTGTALGDPIEITGLTKAYRQYTEDNQFCAIGSVKSNIGHCESAAGIAGLTKILLQMKYKQIVPSLHSNVLNTNIDFETTPFIVPQKLVSWDQPTVTVNSKAVTYPRRAGISAFGAGGSNAHIVIEEYTSNDVNSDTVEVSKKNPAIILLTARQEEQLKGRARDLVKAIEMNHFADADLPRIAYTLQIGRDMLKERLGMYVTSLEELKEKLEMYLNGDGDSINLYIGSAKDDKFLGSVLVLDEDIHAAIEKWFEKGKYDKLLELWAKGFNINWEKQYANKKLKFISLPTYPFANDKYWYLGTESVSVKLSNYAVSEVIHPVLHKNTSSLMQQQFSTTFTGAEFFLNDHIVNGEKILPGVVYLEMARKAIEMSVPWEDGDTVILKNVVWQQPMSVDQPKEVQTKLHVKEDGAIGYAVCSKNDSDMEEVYHCKGEGVLSRLNTDENIWIDLAQIEKQCSKDIISADRYYAEFSRLGIDYGEGNQGIETVYLGEGEALAKLVLRNNVEEQAQDYIIHPSIVDSAFQATLALSNHFEMENKELSLPFSLESLKILGRCSKQMWVYARKSDGAVYNGELEFFDIDIFDSEGNMVILIERMAFKTLKPSKTLNDDSESTVILLGSQWNESSLQSLDQNMTRNCDKHIVLCEPVNQSMIQEIEKSIEGATYHVLPPSKEVETIQACYERHAKGLFTIVKDILVQSQKDDVFIQLLVFAQEEKDTLKGLAGILKTAGLENPKMNYQMIMLPVDSTVQTITKRLKENSLCLEDKEIKYENGIRYVNQINELEKVQLGNNELPWKEGGVYLITGGMGGLGLIFSEEIVNQVKQVNLILTGRSPLNDKKQSQIETLKSKGAMIDYKIADISKAEDVEQLIQSIQESYGGLNGIIHSAGIINDNYIIKKSEEEFLEVLKPKVAGLINLDTYTQGLQMDFIVLFSSLAGAIGNYGQADYACANAFMDAYTVYRNQLVEQGERYGKTVSINWPLWEQGGMLIDEAFEKRMKATTGMKPLATQSGIESLYRVLLNQEMSQVVVLEGDARRIKAMFDKNGSNGQPTVATKKETVARDAKLLEPAVTMTQEVVIEASEAIAGVVSGATLASDQIIKKKTEQYLKKQLSNVTKLPVNQIDSESDMDQYGINSVMIMQVTDELEKDFGSLSKTLFFEYQTIRALTEYFIENFRDQLVELLGLKDKQDPTEVKVANTERSKGNDDRTDQRVLVDQRNTIEQRKVMESRRGIDTRNMTKKKTMAIANHESVGKDPIAVIGVAGKYPQANNLDEFWQNLCDGKDCVTEVPEERWNYNNYYDKDRKTYGKHYSKWGGFIDGIDTFDPLFFNISPREARTMEPQERLFLECVYGAMEDAGYTRESLSQYKRWGLDGNVGVYVGVMYDEYQLFGAKEQAYGNMVAVNGISSSVANRVSYFCNFHGPSLTLNTMCSSSLVAIHYACQSLYQGECDVAIAGGVNVTIHPNKYLLLSQSNFMSSKGCCEAFGEGGDGYVPGEGVGAVLLKPLSKAIEDNDQIYGIIKGSAVNHGGKTNGYTVPNPKAQASMIKETLSKAGINPRHISYIEAHGTGTSLGDPIEIAALTNAFGEVDNEKQFCAIGSVKSNVGHLESAAGIVSLTKVLLQMKYGKLVPSLHSSTLNSNIDFENTPFKVQRTLEEWKRPMISEDGMRREYPRIAGISAFGAGGTNAHIIVEEYMHEEEVSADNHYDDSIILLSGKDETALKTRAEQLLATLEKGQFEDKGLANIAYTLQVGREAMPVRLGMITHSIEELRLKLKHFLDGEKYSDEIFTGHVKNEKETLDAFKIDDDLKNVVDTWISKRKYDRLIEFWVKGLVIDWRSLYGDKTPKKVSLPTYPFTKEKYWIASTEPQLNMQFNQQIISHMNPTRKKVVMKEVPKSQIKKSNKLQNTKAHLNSTLKERTVNYLKNVFSVVSETPLEKIEPDVTLDSYGIDSIMIKKLVTELEKEFGEISPTIFFEYQDIASLGKYLMEKHEEVLMSLFGLEEYEVDDEDDVEIEYKTEECLVEANGIEQQVPLDLCHKDSMSSSSTAKYLNQGDIAIIGMSGRYPQGKDLQAFWENLKGGRDCVSEIPIERWDYRCYFEEGSLNKGKINSKWGGFIQDVDKFDPLFFNVMPEEAERMDPQERLFLQCVYETIEDAGYTKDSLRKVSNDGIEGNVGVYVGVTFSEYQFYGVESQALGKPMAFSGIPSSIANRVSYYCNFNGPSMVIDSMCSSSLTALHVACESMKQGGCKMAVVGGVNLSLHPNKYLFLSQYNFLSSKGRCETFGDKGDGYVPGEGVGAILLKPLAQAEADGDHIYGVIKSTAINHGGKTNGYSVPNPQAQSDVIVKALKNAEVNPRSISYIEAHGTGTSLGDPIEIAGLTKAFRQYTDENSFCAIGSVKSNIGHLEATAAIVGITKVLLQMKYKQLVPSLHSEVLNTNIAFDKTPFKVQRELEAWERPVFDIDGEQRQYPRIAGVSSFGAGGANGHVIIEEYIPYDEEYTEIARNNELVLIILSARSKSRLALQAERLLEAITMQGLGDKDLIHMAYTLQVGRESMDERLGFIVSSIDELRNKLEDYCKDKKQIANCCRSQGKKQKHLLSLFKNTEELRESINRCISKKKLITLLELWVEGLDIDWSKLYGNYQPKRMSLPTYPFEQESYWHGIDTDLRAISSAESQICNDLDDASGDIYEEINSMILQPVWVETEVEHESQGVTTNLKRHIIFCEPAENTIVEQVKANVKDATCHVLSMKQGPIEQQYEHHGKEIFKLVKDILMNPSEKQELVQLVIFAQNEKVILKGLGSILKTASLENPKLSYQVIILPVESTSKDIAQKIEENALCLNHKEIRYENGIRYVHQIEALEEMSLSKQEMPWKEDGIYLITGGLGGLGLIFANEIADQVNHAKIILTGRSPLNDKKTYEIKCLKSKGAIVEYKQVDIVKKEEVVQLIQVVQEAYGRIDGIIHSAGVINDDYIINKTEEGFIEVFKPKVVGIMNLDTCTKDIPMDFMVLFSSQVAEIGNVGQADYAAANAFMDSYAIHRNQLVKEGSRYGKTVTINWPLWESGGMRIDKDIVDIMFEATGMLPMKTETGINAFYQALRQDKDRIMVVEGDIEKINQVVLANKEEVAELDEALEEINDSDLMKKLLQKLVALFGESLKLSVDKIDAEEEFDVYGVDSVKLMVLNQKLSAHFNNLSGTVFFENRTLSKLGEYLIDGYPRECRVWIGSSQQQVKKKQKIKQKKSFKADAITAGRNTKVTKGVKSIIDTREANVMKETKSVEDAKVSVTNTKKLTDESSKSYEPIAIIGVSGRFPEADNLETFWDNLMHQKSCIKVIPEERWSLNGFYTQDKEEALTKKMSFSKWGGFLEGFADFDPLFFNISPVEAAHIDPQERIFLEECWKALEDSGYVPSKMDASFREKIGVFCGMTKTGFNLWNNDKSDSVFNTSFASCVNRVSYFMDLMGPSVPVDTMCSSSLVALHQGCKSIMHGECDMAIVGGVNLYTHPNNYVTLSLGGLISDKPQSGVFAKDGNGFTPSEGVGAVVLKKLSDAIKDNDYVWAVIKGSAICHSGKTNGYNVPDPIKQAFVIQKALEVAEIHPSTIGHIEVAASGSQLVDTIEMEAITKTFGPYRNLHDGNYTMSSIKALMGHGEAVSSMAQLIKALMQLKYKKICPTELPKECNPNIRWNELPFEVATDQREWSQIKLGGTVYPRRIGINSFGAGGVYAHMILEEYQRKEENKGMSRNMAESSIFTFSAKNQEALKEYLEIWKSYLEENPRISLEQLSYILQTKREAMKRRFATVASDVKTLIGNIENYLVQLYINGQSSTVKPQKLTQEEYLTLIKDKEFEQLTQLWMDGAEVPWEQLYSGRSYEQLPQLPKYPFRKRTFWVNFDNEQFHRSDSLNDSLYVAQNVSKEVTANKSQKKSKFTNIDLILNKSSDGETKVSQQAVEEMSTENGEFVPLIHCLQEVKAEENHKEEVKSMIKKILREILYLDEHDEFDEDDSFRDLGLDSITMSKFIQRLNKNLELSLNESVLFDYTNTRELTDYIA